MAGAKNHDYHILPPSIWPLAGAMAALAMASGGIMWMHSAAGGGAVFFAGVAGVLAVMYGWWRQVIIEAHAGDHTPVVQLHLRYGMILFIASEVMFFVAWFWIFFEMALFHHVRTLSAIDDVKTAWATWPPRGIETVPAFQLPLVNTLTLLLSGTTVTWAHHALQTGDRKGAKIGLFLTIALGVLFTSIQAFEYHHILEAKEFFGGEGAQNSGLYGSSFFMATGFHGFHVLIGTIFLTVCLARVLGGGFTPQKHFGFEAAAWYWHFVDVVWLFLFAFIYVIFGAHGGA
jgi:cytochrome c oxidase subunit III